MRGREKKATSRKKKKKKMRSYSDVWLERSVRTDNNPPSSRRPPSWSRWPPALLATQHAFCVSTNGNLINTATCVADLRKAPSLAAALPEDYGKLWEISAVGFGQIKPQENLNLPILLPTTQTKHRRGAEVFIWEGVAA